MTNAETSFQTHESRVAEINLTIGELLIERAELETLMHEDVELIVEQRIRGDG